MTKKKAKAPRIRNSKLTSNKDQRTPTFLRPTVNMSGVVRNEKMEGRDYLVVPMVMIVEGVLPGSSGPLYYPAEELAKVPAVWNHKPVVVYHPTMNGQPVSACDPKIIEQYKIGIIMNTSFDGTALRSEAWLETERVKLVDNRVMEALEADTMMELSTGVFIDEEESVGVFNNQAYQGIARNYKPDHLAILPDQIGACSIQDGAGFLRVNQATMNGRQRELFTFLGLNEDLSHAKIREELRDLIKTTKNDWIYLLDVFDDYFIYEVEEENPYSSHLFTQGYEKKEEVISLVGLPVEVERKVSYEPIINKGIDKMDKTKVINSLIANEKTEWEETDRKFLEGLDDDMLGKVDTSLPTEDPKPAPAANEALKVEAPELAPSAPTVNKEVTTEEYLKSMPPEVRATINSAMASAAQVKAGNIAIIKANAKSEFTDEALSAMSDEQVALVAKMAVNEAPPEATLPNYTGLTPVPASNAEVTEEPLEAPCMVFGDK